MSNFNDGAYIVPERRIVANIGGMSSGGYVASLNGLTGAVNVAEGDGIVVAVNSDTNQITISLATISGGLYVLKSGDYMSGNLIFQGLTTNEFGLGLWSTNTLNESSISNQITGAIYFNTSTDSIRIFNGSGWHNINLDSLTQTTGDARYLQLSGGTMTGSIIMSSSSVITLYNSTTPPATTAPGSVYFNSNTGVKQLQYYNGTSWVGTGSGSVTLINTSNGITGGPISTTGTISLDLTYSPTWTGVHTFTQPIVFSSSQKLLIADLVTSLSSSLDQPGDIIYFDSGTSTYKRLAIGTNGQSLVVVSGIPAWTNSSGDVVTIGSPSSPHIGSSNYDDGYFGGYPINPDGSNQWANGVGNEWISSTLAANAFDDVNQTLWLLSGSQAGLLTGNNLTDNINPSYMFTATLSAGLSSTWTNTSYPAGTIINTYYTSDVTSFNLNSPVNTFRCGKAFRPYTYGDLQLKTQDNTLTSTVQLDYDMTSTLNSPISTGIYTLNVPSVNKYGLAWAEGSAVASINSSSLDGYSAYQFIHPEAGTSNYLPLWRDPVTAASSTPTFSIASSIVKIRNGAMQKFLSGLEYHGYQSVFDVAFEASGGTGASAIFNRCYNSQFIAKMFAPAGLDNVSIPNQGVNLDASENICLPPVTPPNYNAPYTRTGSGGTQKVRIRLSVPNQSSMLNYITTSIYKATGATTPSTATALDLTNTNALAFCTFGSTPTDAIACISTQSNTYANPIALTGTLYSERGYENFTDEYYRVIATSPYTSAWTSSLTSLIAGIGATEAQVRNGIVRYPVSSDYSAYSGASGSKTYCRSFTLVSASTGYLTISPFNITTNLATELQTTISTYSSGDYNAMLYVNGVYYDLAKNFNESGTDGTTLSTAYGARISINNNVVHWSIGTNSTGSSGVFYVILFFNTANIGITSIQSDRSIS